MIQKNELRKFYRSIRKQIGAKKRSIASQAVFDQLSACSFSHIASFSSFSSELNLASLNQTFAQQRRLVLPKVEGENLEFYRVCDLERDLIKSSNGIMEPNDQICEQILKSTIDLILVPGLAFDSERYRLGYGKGHYDRLLAELSMIHSIGIGFSEQKSEVLLPRDSWDIPVAELLLV